MSFLFMRNDIQILMNANSIMEVVITTVQIPKAVTIVLVILGIILKMINLVAPVS